MIDSRGEDSDGSVHVKDLQGDFATDEFVAKNVRVRPSSALSHGKEETKPDDEDEKKYNSETAYDLRQQRQDLKDKKKKIEEGKQMELDKAEKKRKLKI